jgi:hypothetical protein
MVAPLTAFIVKVSSRQGELARPVEPSHGG